MTINAEAYKKAAYPPPITQPESTSPSGIRRFVVKWNNSKSKTASASKYAWHEAEGVKFSNGRIAVDYGPCYAHMGELEETLRQAGEYEVSYIDG